MPLLLVVELADVVGYFHAELDWTTKVFSDSGPS